MKVERDEEGRPKMYAEILTKKDDPKDPFEGLHFVGVYGLPLARYTYNFVDKFQKDEKKRGKQ